MGSRDSGEEFGQPGARFGAQVLQEFHVDVVVTWGCCWFRLLQSRNININGGTFVYCFAKQLYFLFYKFNYGVKVENCNLMYDASTTFNVAVQYLQCNDLATFAQSWVHIIHEKSYFPHNRNEKSACVLYTYYTRDFAVVIAVILCYRMDEKIVIVHTVCCVSVLVDCINCTICTDMVDGLVAAVNHSRFLDRCTHIRKI